MSESIKAAVYELPIIEKDGGLYVSAILLYRKLKISTQYNHWIRRRITQYGFESGLDYRSDLTIRSDGKAGKRVTDFLLTFDMGKELAMLEENDIGRKIRRYFIAIEKRYRDGIGFILPRLTIEKDLFGFREGYNYVELLTSCQLSLKSGSRSARVRKNRQEV